MNDTVLGAIIGAGSAILAGVISSLINHKTNKAHDREKAFSLKKESLYLYLEDLRTNIHNNALIFGKLNKNIDFISQTTLDNEYWIIIKNIKMISKIYFKSIDIQFDTNMEIATDFYRKYAIKLRPETRVGPLLITKELLDDVNKSYDESIEAIERLQNLILDL